MKQNRTITKTLGLLLAGIFLLLLISACGGPGGEAGGTSAGERTSSAAPADTSAGTLMFDGVAVDVATNGVLEIAVADIGLLSFAPDQDANGDDYASFQFQVSDGKEYSADAQMTVDVTPVNDAAPTTADKP